MKPIKLFYQARCPFCKRAFNYIDELKKRPEYKDIVRLKSHVRCAMR